MTVNVTIPFNSIDDQCGFDKASNRPYLFIPRLGRGSLIGLFEDTICVGKCPDKEAPIWNDFGYIAKEHRYDLEPCSFEIYF